MRMEDYPPGIFAALPLPRTVRVCATVLYPHLTTEHWLALGMPMVDLDDMAHTLQVLVPEFEVWEVRDAVDELAQVAVSGWSGYVDGMLVAEAHRRRRVRLRWWCASIVVAAWWYCVA